LCGVMAVFDIDAYLARTRALDVSGIAWADVPKHPVTAETIRTLRYMQDIESHTIVYLRSLLATRAIDDPDVARFLACWVYEETFHGLALERFLAAAGHAAGPVGGGWAPPAPVSLVPGFLRGPQGGGRDQRADDAHRVPAAGGARRAS